MAKRKKTPGAKQLDKKASVLRLRNSLRKNFRDGYPKSNWECKTLNVKPKLCGKAYKTWAKSWVTATEKEGKDPTVEILKKTKDHHNDLKKAGNGVAQKTLIYPYSILGWAGSKKVQGSREHALSMIPQQQRQSWRDSTRSTRDFLAYLSRLNSKKQYSQCLAQVSVQSQDLIDGKNLIHYHQFGLQVRKNSKENCVFIFETSP